MVSCAAFCLLLALVPSAAATPLSAGGPLDLDAESASIVEMTNQPSAGADMVDVGDVNADGYDDYVWTTALPGGMWFIPGPLPARTTDLSHTTVSMSRISVPTGAATRDGTAAGVGDVDGDGIDDLVITDEWGTAWIVYGRPHLASIDLTSHDGSVSRYEGQADSLHGGIVAAAGDVNGDGRADVLLSAPGWQGDGEASRAFVLFGGPRRAEVDLADLGTRGITMLANLDSGSAIAAVGDVNGDGLDDVLLGVRASLDYGGAILAPGSRAGGVRDYADGVAKALAWISDPSDPLGYSLGYALAGVGDYDGDGRPDIAVGVYGGNTTRVAVLTRPEGVIDLGKPGWRGTALDSATGQLVSSTAEVGDVTGDGFDDLLFGMADSTGYAGASLMPGSASPPASIAIATGLALQSSVANRAAGASVAAAGDATGDGIADMIVGTSGSGPPLAPTAYVVAGFAAGGPFARSWVGIQDTPLVGYPLIASAGSFDQAIEAVSYRWRRCFTSAICVAIPGATSSTYRPVTADAGRRLQVQVHLENRMTMAPVAVIRSRLTAEVAGLPVVTGTFRVGRVLRCTARGWLADAGFRWLRNGRPIAGATSARYRLTTKDRHRRITCRVRIGSETALSAARRVR
jgi:hypothetical protein